MPRSGALLSSRILRGFLAQLQAPDFFVRFEPRWPNQTRSLSESVERLQAWRHLLLKQVRLLKEANVSCSLLLVRPTLLRDRHFFLSRDQRRYIVHICGLAPHQLFFQWALLVPLRSVRAFQALARPAKLGGTSRRDRSIVVHSVRSNEQWFRERHCLPELRGRFGLCGGGRRRDPKGLVVDNTGSRRGRPISAGRGRSRRLRNRDHLRKQQGRGMD